MQYNTDDQTTILLILSNICTALSLLGEFWIFFIFLKTRTNWTYSGKIVMCLTFSYFLYTVANILSNFNTLTSLPFCQAEGFIRTFAILSSFFWAWRIARTAYFTMTDIYFRPDPQTGWLKISRGFIVPLVFAVIPIIGFGQCFYGSVGFECSIQGNTPTEALIWDVCIVTVPTLIGLIISIYFYFKIREASTDLELEETLGVSGQKFMIYPVGLCLIWFPSIVYRIVFYFGGYLFWLDAVRTGLGYSLGFLHTVIYVVQGLITEEGNENNKKKNVSMEIATVGSRFAHDVSAAFSHHTPRVSIADYNSFSL